VLNSSPLGYTLARLTCPYLPIILVGLLSSPPAYPVWTGSQRREVAPGRARHGRIRVRYPSMSEDSTKAHGEDAETTAEQAAEIPNESGWVTTEVAAAALRVSPRTVRDYIRAGELEAKSEGEGVVKRWLVSIDAVQALRDKRSAAGEMPRGRRDTTVGDLIAAANAVDIGELVAALRELEHRLGRAEARAELTERTESSLREDLEREREERREAWEENERLRAELEAERSKGFWRRLFGG
jgi:hypothetical protein